MTKTRLVQRLKEIDPEDELRVSTAISEIDALLLALSRKLEEVSLKKLGEEDEES